jgi:DNA-binding LytR/AlgR family response regulator
MRILVAEDNLLFANTIEIVIDELGYELISIVNNATDLLRLNAATEPDLLLLDIQLVGTKDGIDIAKQITDSDRPVPIIFMTAFKDKETFQRAKSANPFAYLIKPFDAVLLQRTIELAFHKYEQGSLDDDQFFAWEKEVLIKDCLFIKVEQRLEKVQIKDITHIDVLTKHTRIYTDTQDFTVRMSLKDLYAKLPAGVFIQINRHTLVNAVHIQHIDLQENRVMVLEKYLGISRKYRDYVLERLNIV